MANTQEAIIYIEKENHIEAEFMSRNFVNKEIKNRAYINAIGGQELYNKEDFAKERIQLKFIKTNDIKYSQLKNEFVPNLSIIDVLMFNSPEHIKEMLEDYELI